MAPPILIVPGWSGSGPEHWQTLWQHELATASRVEMPDWDHPTLVDWLATLDRAVRAAPSPPVLVAHSLGCIAIAHWAARTPAPIRSALLVAPPDLDRDDCPPTLRDFAPIPRARLPFASCVVASDDDPYTELPRSLQMAFDWGSRLVLLDAAGHINTASNLGHWPEGRALLDELVQSSTFGAACT